MINYAGETINFDNCPACNYAEHKFSLPCGMAYENDKFTLSQDWELPIEGFFVVSPKKHIEKFEELDKRESFEIENDLIEKWNKEDILNKSIENRSNTDNWVFYDGPATANGMPGLHHMVAKFLKDSFCKYQTMKGHKVLRKIGWDTHGLPVEVQAEKQLGFSGKSDIEKYGIKEFNEKCRSLVWENEKSFERLTHEMGQFIDMENRYITYKRI